MSYFTWKENKLTKDCSSLDSMAARYEEAANLMRRMSQTGFKLKKQKGKHIITHEDEITFESWGFINEESPFEQLKLFIKEEDIFKTSRTILEK